MKITRNANYFLHLLSHQEKRRPENRRLVIRISLQPPAAQKCGSDERSRFTADGSDCFPVRAR